MYLLLRIKDKSIRDSNQMDNMLPHNYLTDKLFLIDNKHYYEEKHKVKEVKNHNWHHLLKEYGWEKLNKIWIKKLNSYLEKQNNNSLYGCLDCGGEGDCLFHSISYALDQTNDDHDSKTLREQISNSLTKERYEEIIELYQIIHSANEFEEDWNPETMTFELFKATLLEGGDNFWGDFLILNLIKEYLNINIIILNSNEISGEYYHYPLFYEYDTSINTIILLYENEMHFKLVGHFHEGQMNVLFTHQVVPVEILKLINHLR
mgnify:CR=1 FL=1